MEPDDFGIEVPPMTEQKLSFRKKISAILGMAIPPKGYAKVFSDLDRLGKINNKQLIQILIIVCEKLDEYEEHE